MMPRQRTLKKMPNSMDVVRRAIASVTKEKAVTGSLIDNTAMSLSMRTRVYETAQARSSTNKRVIVTFGVGRFQE